MTRLSQFYLRKNGSLAWPLATNALLMQSMVIIDTLLVSPLGEISLAAMGIAGTIITFILGLQLALANGTQLIIGRFEKPTRSHSVVLSRADYQPLCGYGFSRITYIFF